MFLASKANPIQGAPRHSLLYHHPRHRPPSQSSSPNQHCCLLQIVRLMFLPLTCIASTAALVAIAAAVAADTAAAAVDAGTAAAAAAAAAAVAAVNTAVDTDDGGAEPGVAGSGFAAGDQ